MKAILLARVSDKKQDSNEAQVSRVSEYVKHKDLEIWKTYEIEESSTRGDRKRFQEVIRAIEKSKEPIALVVDTVDRLQRSFKESVLLDDLRKAGKIEIHFYRENLILNKDSNSSDLLRWDMAVMFARSYVLQLSDNVKRKIEQKLKNGEWIGQAYVGYKNVTLADGSKDVVPDEDRAHHVQKMFEMFATGDYSVKSMSKEMYRRGLRSRKGMKVSSSQVHAILKNPFYYGEMLVKKKIYEHKYQPLVSRLLFDKVQEVFNGYNRQNFKRTNKPYVFRGLIRCSHCGCAITPELQKEYVYYHCTNFHGNCPNKKVWLREKDLLEQIKDVFQSLKLEPDALEKLKDELRIAHASEKQYYEQNVSAINRQLGQIDARLKMMYNDRLDGRITTTEYDSLVKDQKEEYRSLLEQQKEHSEADKNFYITANKILDLSQRAWELFENSEPKEKTQLVSFLLQNLSLEGRNLLFEVKTPFNGIVEYAKTKEWLRR
ncbi:MAG: cassette chromosome recombinase B [uncultured bacterium]|nr:MAG: cassette chromosome recombinase B [uncultured bacterium]